MDSYAPLCPRASWEGLPQTPTAKAPGCPEPARDCGPSQSFPQAPDLVPGSQSHQHGVPKVPWSPHRCGLPEGAPHLAARMAGCSLRSCPLTSATLSLAQVSTSFRENTCLGHTHLENHLRCQHSSQRSLDSGTRAETPVPMKAMRGTCVTSGPGVGQQQPCQLRNLAVHRGKTGASERLLFRIQKSRCSSEIT